MNIGEAANASGVSAKMLRYYESIGLIPQPGEAEAGYRTYSDADVDTLRFIGRARDFGMPMDRVKSLVGLWQDKTTPSSEVKEIALRQVAELGAKISELTAMKDALAELARPVAGKSAGLSDTQGFGGCVVRFVARRRPVALPEGRAALHGRPCRLISPGVTSASNALASHLQIR